MDSIIVSDYLTPILVFSVLSFLTLVGIFYLLLYVKSYCIDDDKVKEEKEKKLKKDIRLDVLSALRDDFRIICAGNKVLLQKLIDDISLNEECILELNERLNLIEIDIKNIKKVGKKNGSKN